MDRVAGFLIPVDPATVPATLFDAKTPRPVFTIERDELVTVYECEFCNSLTVSGHLHPEMDED